MSWETLQDFFETPIGIVAVILAICVVLVVLMGDLYRKKSLSVKSITYSAICIALAVILSYIKYSMPFGGSITPASMLPIVLAAYWFGPLVGILAGCTHGLIQLAIDPFVIHPIQLLMDYPMAFGALGLAGIFRNFKYGLRIGYLVGVFGRFVMSTLSGYVFFADYTPEGVSPLLYSITYNLSYMAPEAVITLIILSIPAFKSAIDKVKITALS